MIALAAERGGDPERPGKRHPLDPLLWLAARPGEPAWDSPLGRGRPGWHVECSAIALNRLGAGFDVQAGGSDLVFPHHEMSAAHGEVGTGSWPFARAYAHAGMVGLDGHKMSKSRGNLVLVSALREEGVDPMAIRLVLLAQHYRSDWDYTPDLLAAAQARLDRWRESLSVNAAPPAEDTVASIRAALADDLNAPKALAVVASVARDPDLSDADKWSLLADFDQVLGFGLTEAVDPEAADDSADDPRIAGLLAERTAARANKDWAEADRIRDVLAAEGLEIVDTPDGPQARRR